MIVKGQNLRLFLGETEGSEKAVACATSASLHLSANMEDSSTKDSTGDWQEQEVTGRAWDCSSDCLIAVDSTDVTGVQALDLSDLIGKTVFVKIQQTEGTKNRQALSGGICYSGKGIVNDVSYTAGNRQNGTATIQITGTGELTKSTIA